MRSDLVSVIVPVYNADAYLDTCLKGLAEQTYKTLEIILVDDGSSDGSAAICQKWAQRDARIQVLSKVHGGQSEARNMALDICKGKYIVFVDADDFTEPEYVAYLHTLIAENGADLAACEFRFVTSGGRCLNRYVDDGSVRIMNQKQALWELCDDRCISCSPCAKMFSADAFRGIRFPEGHIFEDIATIYKLFLKAENVTFGSRALYHYIRREGSTGTNAFDASRMDSVRYAHQMCSAIVQKWPELARMAQKRLFIEYAHCMRAMSISDDQSLGIKEQYGHLYQKIKVLRRQLPNRRMTPKQSFYVMCSLFGKGALRRGFRLEAEIYRRFRLEGPNRWRKV